MVIIVCSSTSAVKLYLARDYSKASGCSRWKR
jgi:hypothetical protein